MMTRSLMRSVFRALGARQLSSSSRNGSKTKTAILFPGQGSQYVGMGSDIYDKYPSAKHVVDTCNTLLEFRLKDIMFKGPAGVLTSTKHAQPAIVCHSIALLRVLEQELGFKVEKCQVALGHSLGEYSALVATKSLKLENAIRLVHTRGKAMQNSVLALEQETVMKALVIDPEHLEDVESIIQKLQKSLPSGEVAEIANINSRSQVVLSGTKKGVEYANSVIRSKGYSGRSLQLPVSAPFHCRLMTPAVNAMQPALEKMVFQKPVIPVLSNVTSQPFPDPSKIGSLLTRQIAETVQWQRCIESAKNMGVNNWIVVGPAKVLGNLLKKEYPDDTIISISTVEDIAEYGEKLKFQGSSNK